MFLQIFQCMRDQQLIPLLVKDPCRVEYGHLLAM